VIVLSCRSFQKCDCAITLFLHFQKVLQIAQSHFRKKGVCENVRILKIALFCTLKRAIAHFQSVRLPNPDISPISDLFLPSTPSLHHSPNFFPLYTLHPCFPSPPTLLPPPYFPPPHYLHPLFSLLPPPSFPPYLISFSNTSTLFHTSFPLKYNFYSSSVSVSSSASCCFSAFLSTSSSSNYFISSTFSLPNHFFLPPPF